jgi:hypothetical protein
LIIAPIRPMIALMSPKAMLIAASEETSERMLETAVFRELGVDDEKGEQG